MGKLAMVKVNETYVEWLYQFDKKIFFNKLQKRPYIGIVFQIDKYNYYAPLSSPKEKHKTMKTQIDVIKINQGQHGVINLNNMIPISSSNIVKFNILEECNESYKQLLINQVNYMEAHENAIIRQASKLYHKVNTYETFISKRCCDFKLLEQKCLEYEQIQLQCIMPNENEKEEEYEPEI